MRPFQILDEEVLGGQIGDVMLKRAHGRFRRSGWNRLRNAGLDALDGIGLDRLEHPFPVQVTRQDGNVHHLVGIHHKG